MSDRVYATCYTAVKRLLSRANERMTRGVVDDPTVWRKPAQTAAAGEEGAQGGKRDDMRGEWQEWGNANELLGECWSPAHMITSWLSDFLAVERLNLHRRGCVHDAPLTSHAALYHGGGDFSQEEHAGRDNRFDTFEVKSRFLKELLIDKLWWPRDSLPPWLVDKLTSFASFSSSAGAATAIAAAAAAAAAAATAASPSAPDEDTEVFMIVRPYGWVLTFPLIQGETLSGLKIRFHERAEGFPPDELQLVIDGCTLLADDPVTGTLDAALAPVVRGRSRRLILTWTRSR